ncbi:hypothetical protein HaLaN_24848, partial [Haematococcus lacustris]
MRDGLVTGGISMPSSLCCRSTPNPHQPKGLPSSSAARQPALENSEQEDASKSPPSPSLSKAAAA